MRKSIFYISLIGLATLYSCKADQICASYQSYFLVSAKEQPSVFSFQGSDSIAHHEIPTLFALVDEDGVPRKDLANTEKDKNGLVKSEWDIIKNWNKRIVPMEVVLPVDDDSVKFSGDDIMFAERDVVDSVALDSARNAAHTVRYNNDQKFYNWYFKEKLAWAEEGTLDPTPDQTSNQPQPSVNEQPAQEPKPKKNIFKNLFKKKDKETLPLEETGN